MYKCSTCIIYAGNMSNGTNLRVEKLMCQCVESD